MRLSLSSLLGVSAVNLRGVAESAPGAWADHVGKVRRLIGVQESKDMEAGEYVTSCPRAQYEQYWNLFCAGAGNSDSDDVKTGTQQASLTNDLLLDLKRDNKGYIKDETQRKLMAEEGYKQTLQSMVAENGLESCDTLLTCAYRDNVLKKDITDLSGVFAEWKGSN